MPSGNDSEVGILTSFLSLDIWDMVNPHFRHFYYTNYWQKLSHTWLIHRADIGRGLGRNLLHLHGSGVGIDHNPQSIDTAHAAGLEAYLADDFQNSKWGKGAQFDSLLSSHILEHMDGESGSKLILSYLPYLRSTGRIVMLCPQSAGFASDPTHVTYFDSESSKRLAESLGLLITRNYSVPLPQWVGKFFKYSEFLVIARKP